MTIRQDAVAEKALEALREQAAYNVPLSRAARVDHEEALLRLTVDGSTALVRVIFEGPRTTRHVFRVNMGDRWTQVRFARQVWEWLKLEAQFQ